MNGMLCLAKRNVLCYFRDRSSVLFSLMAVFIVVMIYLLFLRNMLIDAYPGTEGMPSLIDAWVLSGILAIVPVTTAAGSLQTMVEDRADGRFAVGLIMSCLALAVCGVYLYATGCPLSSAGLAETAVLTVPSALSGSIIIYAMTSFLRSTGAFSGFFTVVSVLIGFLCGIYMPMGTMPSAMQTVGTLVPASHMAALFRNCLAGDALDSVFGGAPAETVSGFRSDMGFDLSLGSFPFDAAGCLMYVAAATCLFFLIALYGIIRSRAGKD